MGMLYLYYFYSLVRFITANVLSFYLMNVAKPVSERLTHVLKLILHRILYSIVNCRR